MSEEDTIYIGPECGCKPWDSYSLHDSSCQFAEALHHLRAVIAAIGQGEGAVKAARDWLEGLEAQL